MDTRSIRYFDPLLFIAMVVLVVYGLAMIYSATYGTAGTGIDPLVYHQAAYAVVGLVAFVGLSGIDYHVLGNFTWPLYVGGVGLLLVVLVAGRVLHGSQRWIQVGPYQFQPSEIMKLIVVLCLSRYLTQHAEEVRSPKVIGL